LKKWVRYLFWFGKPKTKTNDPEKQTWILDNSKKKEETDDDDDMCEYFSVRKVYMNTITYY